jgi:hypothetical protein
MLWRHPQQQAWFRHRLDIDATASIAFNPEKETRPPIGWLSALRGHYLAVPGMLLVATTQ